MYWEGLDGEVVLEGCGGYVHVVTPFDVDIIHSCHLGPRVLHQPLLLLLLPPTRTKGKEMRGEQLREDKRAKPTGHVTEDAHPYG